MAKNRGPTMDQSQRDKFVDKARELGADEDEAAFEDKLKRIARAGPQPKPGERKKASER